MVLLLAGSAVAAGGAADFYFVDVGHGNATFVVSPSGQTMLLDAGPTRATNRILTFMKARAYLPTTRMWKVSGSTGGRGRGCFSVGAGAGPYSAEGK